VKKIWLMGGFGNVLFQILAYRVLKKGSAFVGYVSVLTENNFITKLLGWTIHEKLYEEFILRNEIVEKNIIDTIIILFFSIFSKVTKTKNIIATFYFSDNKFKKPYALNIFGYFQDKYFLEENRDELLEFGKEIHIKYKMNESYIVVHYRMGDSDWARKYENYYSEVKRLIKLEHETVLVVTDSPKEAKVFFSDCNNVRLTDAKNAKEDFRYMVSAKKLYCAPSTFSWWASHSLSVESEVIMPVFLQEKLGIYIENNITIL